MANYYTRTLDFLNVERPKCKCCGEDIIYDNTDVTYYDGNINIKGKSYKTVKVVNNVSYSLKVCQKCLLKHYPNIKNLSRIFNVMGEPTKFAFEIPDDIYIEKRGNYAMTKNKMIEKYGEEEGNKRWESYCARQAETNTLEYKQKTYGWTEEQFKEYNKSRAVTLKNLIKRYGEEEGNKRWEEYCNRQAETKSWDYMVEHYGETKAREINKNKAITLENLVKKYGDAIGNQKWLEYLVNRNNGVSEISQQLFKELDKYIGKNHVTYYHDKNDEYFVWGEDHLYYLDYYIKDLNICVEFNGGCFHGDSRIYEDNEYCNPFVKNITAKELREKDQERYEYLLNKYGIKTYVIWELDYNPETFNYIDYIKNTLKITIDE